MIPQEYTSTLFNSIAFHDPFFDRTPAEDYQKDMYETYSEYPANYPSTYPTFRRMSADTQASSADSSAAYPSPDHKPHDKILLQQQQQQHQDKLVVLPPIHDLPRALSPADQHQQQHQNLQHFQFPPIDHSRRPHLHINPDQRTPPAPAPYPTPASASNYSSYNYASFARRPEDPYPAIPRSVPPPPPVVTPATLAAAVGTQQRRRGKLPKPVTEFLKKWLLAHTDHPYPTEDEKKWLCSETGLSMSQVSNWMINARRRILAPAAKANAVANSTTAPYYSRSPPVRTVSGSSSGDASYSSYQPARRESYTPYPAAASRTTNSHPSQHPVQYPPTPNSSYPSTASSYPAYSFQGGAPPNYGPSTLAPFGDSHEPTHGSPNAKSPNGEFAFPQ